MSEENNIQAGTGASNPASSPQTATCPSCGAAVSAGAKFCGNCGKPMARFCANCGSPLQPGVKFCGECGTPAGGTAPQGGGNPASSVLSAPGVEMSPGNIRFTPPDAGTAGSGDAAPPQISGNTPAERIQDYIQKTYNNTSCVVTGEKLTAEFLEAGGLNLEPGEKALLALKTWMNTTDKVESFVKDKFKGFGAVSSFLKKAKMGTMMLTDRRMVWVRLRPDTFAAGMSLAGTINGEIALDAIRSVSLGNHDHCFGSAYMGHQLLVNGKVIGLLRMGSGVVFDEETIDYLVNLFSACFKV